MAPLTTALVMLASTAAVWVGSGMLDKAAERLAEWYRLPPTVQGAVIAAVGSSFPELSTAVVSTWLHGEFALGVSAIVGSALFNVLVIPALSGLAAGGLRYDLGLVYRDAQYYLVAIAVLLLSFALAVIYEPAAGERKGTLTPVLVLLPLAAYGLYLFLQQQESNDSRRRKAGDGTGAGSDPVSDGERGASGGGVRIGREWLRLVGSLALTLAGVEGLVRGAIELGRVFDVPSFYWGLTVVAVATSVPDTLVSMRAARRPHGGEISLANVFGSNVFDLLVAVPAGVLVAGSAVVDFGVAAPMMGFLAFATVVLFVAMRIRLRLAVGECWMLLLLYAGFLVLVVLEALGVVDLTSG